MPNTREKLIELLLGRKEVVSEVCENTRCKTCQYEKYGFNCDKAILADHLIANGVTVQKWIPVSEKLPSPGVDVLCWYEYFRFGSYNRMYQTYGIGYYFRDGMWGGEVSNGQACKVLAWMPLPERPKEDSNL